MTETVVVEPTVAEKALANQGVKPEDLNPGHVGGGNPTPKPASNVKGDNEEHGVPVKKAPSETKTPEEKAKEDADAAIAAKVAADAAEAAKKAAVVDSTDPDVGVTKYAEFENPHAQAAVSMLKDAGVTALEANAIFNKAVESKNLADVDWSALEAKVGKDKALLIRTGVETYYNEEFKHVSATVTKGHEIVGGEANWKKIADWSNKKAASDPAYKAVEAEIRNGINQNGWLAEQSITRLKGLYEADPANSGLGVAKIIAGDTPGNVTGTALSRADYMVEMHKLHARKHTATELQSLRARRQLGMSAGI
jgi:hypothetical protein